MYFDSVGVTWNISHHKPQIYSHLKQRYYVWHLRDILCICSAKVKRNSSNYTLTHVLTLKEVIVCIFDILRDILSILTQSIGIKWSRSYYKPTNLHSMYIWHFERYSDTYLVPGLFFFHHRLWLLHLRVCYMWRLSTTKVLLELILSILTRSVGIKLSLSYYTPTHVLTPKEDILCLTFWEIFYVSWLCWSKIKYFPIISPQIYSHLKQT